MPVQNTDQPDPQCSFCGQPPRGKRSVSVGELEPSARICTTCVTACVQLVQEVMSQRTAHGTGDDVATPADENQSDDCCSFCGGYQRQRELLIGAGPGSVCICNECVALSAEIISEQEDSHSRVSDLLSGIGGQ